MLVKYIGHADMMSADWNGKRYCLSKRNPIVDIPVGLYDMIKSSNFVGKHDVIPEIPVVKQDVPLPIIKQIVPLIKDKTNKKNDDSPKRVRPRKGN